MIFIDRFFFFFFDVTKFSNRFVCLCFIHNFDRWVVLFSHPSDFTPVCTTELGRIAVHKEHFAKRNVKLLAHSVDDLDSHVDWVNVGFCLIQTT